MLVSHVTTTRGRELLRVPLDGGPAQPVGGAELAPSSGVAISAAGDGYPVAVPGSPLLVVLSDRAGPLWPWLVDPTLRQAPHPLLATSAPLAPGPVAVSHDGRLAAFSDPRSGFRSTTSCSSCSGRGARACPPCATPAAGCDRSPPGCRCDGRIVRELRGGTSRFLGLAYAAGGLLAARPRWHGDLWVGRWRQ